MAYERSYWKDHVEDQHGHVIQQGTLQDQQHFNNMEVGISDNNLAHAITMFKQIQEDYDYQDELKNLDLAMDALKWPFNNKPTTVALSQIRESINYSVEVNVLGYSGGLLGKITVLDRARNGFKLLHDGSATHVQVAVRISGGMTDPMLDESDIE
ncbi:MAG: hypothetical protein J6N53_08060 [Lachnospiraceae bacterium]|nr:hypothetical protein [Lachnospiraceae bacterium]MBR6849777.1 hypothetical protein [Lachnospiraceae bacterium]